MKDKSRKIVDAELHEVNVKNYSLNELEDARGLFIVEKKNYRKLYETIANSEWFKKAYVGKSLGDDDTEERRELTKFEKAVKEMVDEYIHSGYDEMDWSDAVAFSGGLLEIATEGYRPIDVVCKELEMKGNVEYTKGYTDAKIDAEKNLPRWKVADRNIFSDTIDFAFLCRHDGGDYPDYDSVEVTNRIMEGDRYIELSDLEKLPS